MAADSAAAASPERPAQERFGPLAIARLQKDDGRSLIIYSHDENGAEAGAAPDPAPAGDDEPA